MFFPAVLDLQRNSKDILEITVLIITVRGAQDKEMQLFSDIALPRSLHRQIWVRRSGLWSFSGSSYRKPRDSWAQTHNPVTYTWIRALMLPRQLMDIHNEFLWCAGRSSRPWSSTRQQDIFSRVMKIGRENDTDEGQSCTMSNRQQLPWRGPRARCKARWSESDGEGDLAEQRSF